MQRLLRFRSYMFLESKTDCVSNSLETKNALLQFQHLSQIKKIISATSNIGTQESS